MKFRTSFVVELLHDFADDLTNRLDRLDVIFRLGEVFLEVFQ